MFPLRCQKMKKSSSPWISKVIRGACRVNFKAVLKILLPGPLKRCSKVKMLTFQEYRTTSDLETRHGQEAALKSESLWSLLTYTRSVSKSSEGIPETDSLRKFSSCPRMNDARAKVLEQMFGVIKMPTNILITEWLVYRFPSTTFGKNNSQNNNTLKETAFVSHDSNEWEEVYQRQIGDVVDQSRDLKATETFPNQRKAKQQTFCTSPGLCSTSKKG